MLYTGRCTDQDADSRQQTRMQTADSRQQTDEQDQIQMTGP